MAHRYDDLDLDELRQRHSVKWREHPPDVLPAWVAEMDYPLARPVVDAIQAALRRGGDVGYPPDGVVPQLAEAYAGFSRRRFGWAPDPARVFVLPDVMRGVELWIELCTGPGDAVVVNTPVYPPFLHAVRDSGRRLVEAPLRRGLDLTALAEAFRAGARLWLLCNPHNPTGHVVPEDDLRAAAALCERYGVRVVADEVHGLLTYAGARHVPFASLGADAAARTLTVTSATKAWNFPGLKCAVAVPGSAQDAALLAGLPLRARMGAGLLGIDAVTAAYSAGEPWLEDTLGYLDGNRRLLRELLSERLPAVRYDLPEATYLGWLDCRALQLRPDPYTVFLERGRVALYDGAQFGAPGRDFVRLNFATSRAILTEVVDRMASAVHEGR